MLILKRVAVTGGLASGKSTVADVFQKLGAFVVSADQIAHQLLDSGTSDSSAQVSKQVISLLGNEVLSDGVIDRKKVAEVVFDNAALLYKLEALIHPYVAQEIQSQWQNVKNTEKYLLFVAEVPLLFEAHQEEFYDAVVAVTAPIESCIERYSRATGKGRDEYMRRESNQLNAQEKASRADFVIENSGTIQELEEKASSLFKQLYQQE